MIRIEPDELRRLAETSELFCRDRLIAAIESQRREVTALGSTSARELLSIYRVRYDRWKRERIPPSEGFPDFLETLKGLQHGRVIVTALHVDDGNVILLISPNRDKILACLLIDSKLKFDDVGL